MDTSEEKSLDLKTEWACFWILFPVVYGPCCL